MMIFRNVWELVITSYQSDAFALNKRVSPHNLQRKHKTTKQQYAIQINMNYIFPYNETEQKPIILPEYSELSQFLCFFFTELIRTKQSKYKTTWQNYLAIQDDSKYICSREIEM